VDNIIEVEVRVEVNKKGDDDWKQPHGRQSATMFFKIDSDDDLEKSIEAATRVANSLIRLSHINYIESVTKKRDIEIAKEEEGEQ